MTRVTDAALEFDKDFMRELYGVCSDNARSVRIMCEMLHEIIEKDLTPRQREVLTMYYFENMRVCEIARKFGVAGTNVSRTRRRAERHIHEKLRYAMRLIRIGEGG